MRRYLLGVSGVVAALTIVVSGSVFTPYGFALAGDAQTKEEAAKSIEPLTRAVTEINTKLAANESANKQMLGALNELRAASIAINIDRLVRRRCLEQDIDEVNSLRRDIDQQKAVYRALANIEYTEPTCAEVRR